MHAFTLTRTHADTVPMSEDAVSLIRVLQVAWMTAAGLFVLIAGIVVAAGAALRCVLICSQSGSRPTFTRVEQGRSCNLSLTPQKWQMWRPWMEGDIERVSRKVSYEPHMWRRWQQWARAWRPDPSEDTNLQHGPNYGSVSVELPHNLIATRPSAINGRASLQATPGSAASLLHPLKNKSSV